MSKERAFMPGKSEERLPWAQRPYAIRPSDHSTREPIYNAYSRAW